MRPVRHAVTPAEPTRPASQDAGGQPGAVTPAEPTRPTSQDSGGQPQEPATLREAATDQRSGPEHLFDMLVRILSEDGSAAVVMEWVPPPRPQAGAHRAHFEQFAGVFERQLRTRLVQPVDSAAVH